MSTSARYIPALSFKWLTPLYDPLLKWAMREETFKRRLIEQANIQMDMNLLDVGCGCVNESEHFLTLLDRFLFGRL